MNLSWFGEHHITKSDVVHGKQSGIAHKAKFDHDFSKFFTGGSRLIRIVHIRIKRRHLCVFHTFGPESDLTCVHFRNRTKFFDQIFLFTSVPFECLFVFFFVLFCLFLFILFFLFGTYLRTCKLSFTWDDRPGLSFCILRELFHETAELYTFPRFPFSTADSFTQLLWDLEMAAWMPVCLQSQCPWKGIMDFSLQLNTVAFPTWDMSFSLSMLCVAWPIVFVCQKKNNGINGHGHLQIFLFFSFRLWPFHFVSFNVVFLAFFFQLYIHKPARIKKHAKTELRAFPNKVWSFRGSFQVTDAMRWL